MQYYYPDSILLKLKLLDGPSERKKLDRIDVLILLRELKACSRSRNLAKARKAHETVTKTGCENDMHIASTLVDMYAKCRSMLDARRVFDRMKYRDVVAWTALILGYAENGEPGLALKLFAEMHSQGCEPDSRSFAAAVRACIVLALEQEHPGRKRGIKMRPLMFGIAIHLQARERCCDQNIFVASALVDMYSKCGSMVDAREVFERMTSRDVVAWTVLLVGYAENREEIAALELFERMIQEGCAPNAFTFVGAVKACTALAAHEEAEGLLKLNCLSKGRHIHSQVETYGYGKSLFVANTLVGMYAKCGSMSDARRVFDKMEKRNVISWNALMFGYLENGEADETLNLMARMSCVPDARTFVAALKACGVVMSLELGRKIHADVCRLGFENVTIVGNALVDFYGKCGSMTDAQSVFDELQKRNLVTWNALMAGYTRLGETKRVFGLFRKLRDDEGLQPDAITFLCLLSACGHAGLVEKGKEYFESMRPKYKVSPGIEHYHCMVDILGRANKLEDAVEIVRGMPFKPQTEAWTAVLDGCRKWRNVVVGKLAFESLLKLQRQDAAAYILMANIYGCRGMWEEQLLHPPKLHPQRLISRT